MTTLSDRYALFLKRSLEAHGNKYDYSKVVYVNAKIKVTIVCPLHGEFQQDPSGHVNGRGCIECGKKAPSGAKRLTSDVFIERSKKVHGDLYDYSKSIYTISTNPVTIICRSCNVEFSQLPKSHMKGHGCKKCASIRIGNAIRKPQEKFIEEAMQKHGTLYDYSKVVYVDSFTPVTIICKIHNEFQQQPVCHLNFGCRQCGNILSGKMKRLTQEEYITRCTTIHNGKYDYSKCIYVKSIERVTIICPEHGEFIQQAFCHIQGYGCDQCGNQRAANLIRLTNYEFIDKARLIHGHKYTYDKVVYIRSIEKVIITCPVHGDFEQTPNSHLCGCGCYRCGRVNSSKVSLEWLRMIKCTHPNLISEDHEDGEYRIPFTNYHADGYCPDTNTIYEFHGDYWHGNPSRYAPDVYNHVANRMMGELYQRTLQKKAACEALGYRYVEMWESEWNMAKNVLRKRLRQR